MPIIAPNDVSVLNYSPPGAGSIFRAAATPRMCGGVRRGKQVTTGGGGEQVTIGGVAPDLHHQRGSADLRHSQLTAGVTADLRCLEPHVSSLWILRSFILNPGWLQGSVQIFMVDFLCSTIFTRSGKSGMKSRYCQREN